MEVIAFSNQKGGVGKTTTTLNLGIGLAQKGKRVLLIDADPQGNLTTALGYKEADDLPVSLATVLRKRIFKEPVPTGEGILHHAEGVDLMPGNTVLEDIAITLVAVDDREFVLKEYIDELRPQYDYILIDCGPTLGVLNVNALTAADSVIIPVQTQYLSMKGLEMLLSSVKRVQKRFNTRLAIKGVVLTMVDRRTALSREVSAAVQRYYGGHIPIFTTQIPISTKAAEAAVHGKSVFAHDPSGRASEAYLNLTKEVCANGKPKQYDRTAQVR